MIDLNLLKETASTVQSDIQTYALNNDFLLKILAPELIAKLTSTKSFVVLTTGIFITIIGWFFNNLVVRGEDGSGKSGSKKKRSARKSKKISKQKKKSLPEDPMKRQERLIKEIVEDSDAKIEPEVLSWEKNVMEKNENSQPLDKKEYEKLGYKRKYLEERILKELMKLDDIDHFGNQELRLQRKAAIKHIQNLHKRIDSRKGDFESLKKITE